MAATFFGLQLALALPPRHPLRPQFSSLVNDSQTATSLIAQRTCWSQAARLVAGALTTATRGTWDLITVRAEEQYEEWASGLEAMANWPASDFGDDRPDQREVLVTFIFLVQGGSNADLTLGDACDLPEKVWHRRETYRTLLGIPPTLNFTGVLGSGLYLAPRPDQPGFSPAVLTGEGFEYLDPVT